VDLLSLYLQNEGNSHSNRLELLAVSSGNKGSKNRCLPSGIFLLSWDTLHSNTMLPRHFWKSRKTCCISFSARKATELENICFGLYVWWARRVKRYMFQWMSLKNSHRKIMLNWVFVVSFEPFKSLQLQNLTKFQ